MRIRQLEYFIRVCETGSITAAAQQMNVAQPALGMQIKALEAGLGVRLLDRTARGTQPTPAGRLFLEEARHIVARLRLVRRRAQEVDAGAPPTVNLGLTPSLTALLTQPLLAAAQARAPHLKLQIFADFSHALIEQLDNGQLDCGLAYSVPSHAPLHREPKLRERLVFVCRPGSPMDVQGPIAFHELADVPLAMPGKQDLVRQRVESELERNGLSANIVYDVEAMSEVKELILQGAACGILPSGIIAGEVAEGHLAIRVVIDPPITRILYLVHAADARTDPARRLIIQIVDALLTALPAEHPFFSPYSAP